MGITSIAIPPLGCGNGKLEWKAVGPLIYGKVKQMDIPVEVYAPYGTKPAQLTVSFLENMSEAGSAGVSEPRSSHKGLNPAWLGLIEILKRMKMALKCVDELEVSSAKSP